MVGKPAVYNHTLGEGLRSPDVMETLDEMKLQAVVCVQNAANLRSP
jgi:hypothetical protein